MASYITVLCFAHPVDRALAIKYLACPSVCAYMCAHAEVFPTGLSSTSCCTY